MNDLLGLEFITYMRKSIDFFILHLFYCSVNFLSQNGGGASPAKQPKMSIPVPEDDDDEDDEEDEEDDDEEDDE